MMADPRNQGAAAPKAPRTPAQQIVQDYFEHMLETDRSPAISAPEGWPEIARRMSKKRMPRDAAVRLEEAIARGPQRDDVLSIMLDAERALGRDVEILQVLRGTPERARLVTDSGPGREEDWLLVARETVEIRHDRFEVALNSFGLGLTRGALERLCEREDVEAGGLGEAIRTRIGNMYGQIAFNLTYDLMLPRLSASPDERAVRTAIPFGDGLLVIEMREVTEAADGSGGDTVRATIRNGRIVTRRTEQNEIHVRYAQMNGRRYVTRRLWIATDYVPAAGLQPDQAKYRDAYVGTTPDALVKRLARMLWDVGGRAAAGRQISVARAVKDRRRKRDQEAGGPTARKEEDGDHDSGSATVDGERYEPAPDSSDQRAVEFGAVSREMREWEAGFIEAGPREGDWMWTGTTVLDEVQQPKTRRMLPGLGTREEGASHDGELPGRRH